MALSNDRAEQEVCDQRSETALRRDLATENDGCAFFGGSNFCEKDEAPCCLLQTRAICEEITSSLKSVVLISAAIESQAQRKWRRASLKCRAYASLERRKGRSKAHKTTASKAEVFWIPGNQRLPFVQLDQAIGLFCGPRSLGLRQSHAVGSYGFGTRFRVGVLDQGWLVLYEGRTPPNGMQSGVPFGVPFKTTRKREKKKGTKANRGKP